MTTWNLKCCPYCGKKLPELKKDVVICSCGGVFQINVRGWCITNDETVLEEIGHFDEDMQRV